MTDHPCKGMTKRYHEIFEQIAVNQPPRCRDSMILQLKLRGLVEVEYKTLRDKLGEYKIPVYSVPLPIHMQWCEWCSEQPENSEATQ